MATIKSFSDLEQSRKLAKILPLDSADMFIIFAGDREIIRINDDIKNYNHWDVTPVWSLATLFGVLPILDNRSPVISKTFDKKYRVLYHSTAYEKAILTNDYDNPVDACYELILKLEELNLL